MPRRPNHFQFAIADFDHVAVIDVLVGIGDRPIHRGAHPRRTHPGWSELFDGKTMALKEGARLGTVGHAHPAELDHTAGALGLETKNMRRRVTAAPNLAGRAEMIDVMMGRDDRVEILDLDSDFG